MPETRHSAAPERVLLDSAELIEIAGADAIAFAHAQFSSDVASLAASAWQASAWLNAEGRVRAVFALLRVADDRLLAWLPLGGAHAIADALRRYVLRAKVRIAVLDWMLARSNAAESTESVRELDGGYAFALDDKRTAWLGPSESSSLDRDALVEWRLADVAAGFPWLAPAMQATFLPQSLDLGRIGALRLDKGCFPGQEIAARLHFRGGLKQRMHRIVLRGAGDATPGLSIRSEERAVGAVLYGARSSAASWEALAVIEDAAFADAHLASPHGHEITLHKSN